VKGVLNHRPPIALLGFCARAFMMAASNQDRSFNMSAQSVFDFTVKNAQGEDVALSAYAGKPMLIINTASKCGFTGQYAGLEALHRKYGDRLTILAFPCNQFGAQEPGDAAEIASFCSLNYDVTFPVMRKIDVNGDGAEPLYNYLKSEKPGLLGSKGIKWNFTKFLVDADGKVVSRHAPNETPASLERDIERVLGS
jgi:glutathione peroxidase